MSLSRHAPAIFAVFALAGLMAAAWPFTIDDAFIVGRYADRLAGGRGYTYEDGIVSDGVSGPLWLLPLTLAARSGLDPVSSAKWLGAGAAMLALWAVIAHLQRRALGRRSAWIAALTCASSWPLAIWAVAGLETGLAALCASALSLAAVRRPRASGAQAGFASAALFWLRPELLPFALSWLAVLAWRSRRAAKLALGIALLGAITVIVFRLALFDHVLPMSARAKPPLLANGMRYLGAALLRPRAVFLAAALAVACALAGPQAAALSGALAVQLVAIALAGGDWMPGRRLFVPVLPTLVLAVALGVSRLSLRRPTLAWGLLGCLLVSGCFELVPELIEARRAGLLRAARAPALVQRVCEARGPVAVVDIGLLGYACPEQGFLDLGGLTDPVLAYARGGHLDKQVDGAWLRARAPGLVVLHSRERPRIDGLGRVRWFAGYPVERRVLALPFIQREYAAIEVFEYAPRYFYVLLAPRQASAR